MPRGLYRGWPTIAFGWQLWGFADYTNPCHSDFIVSTTHVRRISSRLSCYHRFPHLADPAARDLFVRALERTRVRYRMYVYGFVVMPEHVHLLVSEPQRGTIANAIQSLKIASAKAGKRAHVVRNPRVPFWQKRYYDRNEWDHKEFLEKLKYIHRNPVKRGLVKNPEGWRWSSFRHYANGENCGVEIESWRNRTYSFPMP